MGLSIDATGRSICGGVSCDIEPRFESSYPFDKSKNNPRDVLLKFTTYCYESFVRPEDCVVEISEDAGATFVVAYDGSVFQAPYDGVQSKFRRYDSQRIVFFIHKTTTWPLKGLVIIRLTAYDEYGNVSTKVDPVTWD